MSEEPSYQVGDPVEYVGEPVFDGIIATGERGSFIELRDAWLVARWPRSGVHSVPREKVRPAAPLLVRAVEQAPNERIWGFVGGELPPLPDGRERDPYWESGSHPDVVERVWDVLGWAVPAACRARAQHTPVLAHPDSGRVFAAAHGTAYALWLIPRDYDAATAAGLTTLMKWTGGTSTDLREVAGPGWLWGAWHDDEPGWVHRAFEAQGPRS